MAKGWTKGSVNLAQLYVQRGAAIKKLGLTLADFRKLCILKGIHPRVPKKQLSKDKVYYHVRDVKLIAHDPLIQRYREQKIAKRRIKKALGKNEVDRAKAIASRVPVYNLAHILKQRYPTFLDALRDLDDALSCVALFSMMPVKNDDGISGDVVIECRELLGHWQAFVATTHSLTKTFASLKGYYFEAEIFNQKIVWLVPHEFANAEREDVDLKVMATFLELYRSLLKFSLFKLYNLCGVSYPPTKSSNYNNRWMSYRPGEMNCDVNVDGLPLIPAGCSKNLFKDQVFFISRETPIFHLLLVLRSAGAKAVGWQEIVLEDQDAQSPVKESDGNITHHIVDRPAEGLKVLMDSLGDQRIFIQPQWVFDSFNFGALLPTTPYSPGVQPPPHLSPFVTNDELPARKTFNEWLGVDTSQLDRDKEVEPPTREEYEVEEVQAVLEIKDSIKAQSKLVEIKKRKTKERDEAEVTRRTQAMPRKKREMYKKIMAKRNDLSK